MEIGRERNQVEKRWSSHLEAVKYQTEQPKNGMGKIQLHTILIIEFNSSFLDASTHLYERLCPLVRRSVGPSVGPSVSLSIGLSVGLPVRLSDHPSVRL